MRVIAPGFAASFLSLVLVMSANAAGQVRYAPGLVTTSVVHDVIDYEGLTVVKAVASAQSTAAIRWVRDDPSAPGKKKELSANMTTLGGDRENSRRVMVSWMTGDPETIPGAIWGGFSQLVLRELKQQGKSAIVLGAARATKPEDLVGGLLTGRKYYRGTLERVEAGTVPFSVLLDGKRTSVPVVHAKGRVTVGSDSSDAEFWILDDAEYPITLRWSALGASVTVVRIDNPVTRTPQGGAAGGIALQGALSAGTCRAELHGIYFNTASATLLPESRPALEEIAALLKGQPAWKVTVEGHTDNIGAADYNLSLSRARAAAVRDELVKNHRIAPDRLTATGFGATRPVETNGTLEGRAHNRRVELARQCQ